MPAALQTDAIIQRIIDIMKASTSPDLRLKSAGGPVEAYIFGRPDENELPAGYPVIWVEAGGPSGDMLSDAGYANDTQIGHFFTATIGMLASHVNAQTAEKNALSLHDDVRVALRSKPDLNDGTGAMVQAVSFAWASSKDITQNENTAEFTTEFILVCRWLLNEDVV